MFPFIQLPVGLEFAGDCGEFRTRGPRLGKAETIISTTIFVLLTTTLTPLFYKSLKSFIFLGLPLVKKPFFTFFALIFIHFSSLLKKQAVGKQFLHHF